MPRLVRGTGGDEALEELILFGEFLLVDMPQELWADGALEQRVAWMNKIDFTGQGKDVASDLAAVLAEDADDNETTPEGDAP